METTLRVFYARALGLLLFFICVAALALVIVSPALAQEAAPAATIPGAPWWLETGVQALVLILGAVWTAVGAWQAKHLPAAKVAKTKLDETLDAMNWEDHLRTVVANAFGYATTDGHKAPEDLRTGAERAAFLKSARSYVKAANPEVVQEHGEATDLILLAHLGKITGKVPPAAQADVTPIRGNKRSVQ
jgi:hypothetical protein